MTAVGRITLSSCILQFWDLGGQRELRALWPKYYAECSAVCFVVDSTDTTRMDDTWIVFDEIVGDRRIEGLPTLVLANKQDDPKALHIESIKERFNKHVDKMNVSEAAVMPISALKGLVDFCIHCLCVHYSTGSDKHNRLLLSQRWHRGSSQLAASPRTELAPYPSCRGSLDLGYVKPSIFK